ncbi:hypothetical protein STEG23_034962, partial [Scotinomys teguina]
FQKKSPVSGVTGGCEQPHVNAENRNKILPGLLYFHSISTRAALLPQHQHQGCFTSTAPGLLYFHSISTRAALLPQHQHQGCSTSTASALLYDSV